MSANPENRLKVALVQMQSQCELRKNIEQAISFLSDAIETHQYEVVDFYDHLIIYQHENIYPVSVRQNSYLMTRTNLPATPYSVI